MQEFGVAKNEMTYHLGEHGQDDIGDGHVGGELSEALADDDDDEQDEVGRQHSETSQRAADQGGHAGGLGAVSQSKATTWRQEILLLILRRPA